MKAPFLVSTALFIFLSLQGCARSFVATNSPSAPTAVETPPPVINPGLAVLHQFYPNEYGGNPNGRIIASLDGKTLYGVTSVGGDGGDGTIFSLPVSGGNLSTLYVFHYNDGASPSGRLLLSLDGSTLYGTAMSGGAHEQGTIFKIATTGGSLTTLHAFNGADGSNPYGGLIRSADGSTLYGMTMRGGVNGVGTIYRIPANGGSLTTLHSFSTGDGSFPYGSLVLSSDGTTLYGFTSSGGARGAGTIFSISSTGAGFTTLHHFNISDGYFPTGSLILSSDGSTLYGMTNDGGARSAGVVFCIPSGGGSLVTLHTFNTTNGAHPYGSLVFSSDESTLYGMTYRGGQYGNGTIFSIPKVGGTLNTLLSFGTPEVSAPYGDLIWSADRKKVFGFTSGDNSKAMGSIFSFEW